MTSSKKPRYFSFQIAAMAVLSLPSAYAATAFASANPVKSSQVVASTPSQRFARSATPVVVGQQTPYDIGQRPALSTQNSFSAQKVNRAAIETKVRAAAFGVGAGGGGSICDDRIKIIRDDLEQWLKNPQTDLSSLVLEHGMALDQYRTQMLSAIASAQVSCTDDKVEIGNDEKTCKGFVQSDGTRHIECNTHDFLEETSDSDQYRLIHHEFAGLAGIEINNGSDSDYSVSNQITEYLQNTVVKRLAIKPQLSQTGLPGGDPVSAYLRDQFQKAHSPSAHELVGLWRDCEEHAASAAGMSDGPGSLITVSSIPGLSYGITELDGMFRVQGNSIDMTLATAPNSNDGLVGVPDADYGVAGDKYGVRATSSGDIIMEVDLNSPSDGYSASDYAPSIIANGSLLVFAYTICPARGR